jgi:5-formyltetrahydrofolate cyclo-ligase
MGGGVCFVPQLAVDAKGYRLGYGGGYYDRFLGDPSVSSALLLVACSHEDLMVPDLPREPHDIPVDIIVTRKDLRLLISVDQMLSKLGIANEKRSASRVPSGSL